MLSPKIRLLSRCSRMSVRSLGTFTARFFASRRRKVGGPVWTEDRQSRLIDLLWCTIRWIHVDIEVPRYQLTQVPSPGGPVQAPRCCRGPLFVSASLLEVLFIISTRHARTLLFLYLPQNPAGFVHCCSGSRTSSSSDYLHTTSDG